MKHATIPIILLILGTLLAKADLVEAQAKGMLPPEAEQILFLIDDSASMMETASDPDEPAASRWQVVQRAYPKWLERLGPDSLVGAVSVGGRCGAPPAIDLPVGTDPKQLSAAIGSARPNGATNLNAALMSTPTLFAPGVRGGRRVVLLSDGLNTCPPRESTCEIARQLHRDHGIVIDVVAWVTEPGMVDEFKCVAQASGGTFTAPRTIKEVIDIPLPVLDPWRYVVLGLGFGTLLLAGRVFYRHVFHVLNWGTGQATLAAGVLLGLGTLALYLVLFVRTGIGAAMLGVSVLVAMLAVAWRRSRPSSTPAASAPPWSLLGFVVVVTLLIPPLSFAAAASPTTCSKVVQGPPRYHHILALDVSGTVAPYLGQMKALLACYAERYTVAGEEVSFIVFGSDSAGTVKELTTFTVPPSGSTIALNTLLDSVAVRNPKDTKTYFKPLADYLNQFLRHVRLQPVIIVVSDGQSDAEQDRVPFKEVPFAEFGTRGLYSVPGTHKWKVAIQGGSGLDLAALFQKPIGRRGELGSTALSRPRHPVIDPCLLEPELLVETDERIVLRPRWNPLSTMVDGSVTVRARNECVARFRSFRVELRRGNETLLIGRVNNTLIDEQPRSFTFPTSQPTLGAGMAEATLRVLLDQGGTPRTIYPQRPSLVTVEELSYWSAFGLYWGLINGTLLVLIGVAVRVVRRRRAQERNRPEVVKVPGGHVVPLFHGQAVTVGGEGCQLVVPEVQPGVVLALIEWTGIRGAFTLRPGKSFRMLINGAEVDGPATYRLGQALQFIPAEGGTPISVTLYPGTTSEIGFSPTPVAGGDRSTFVGAFPSFSDMGQSSGNGAFSSMPGTSGGHGISTDSYI